MGKIELIKGDITTQKVDAIVNAANRTLLGGGGVDGAIHRAAGPMLLEECRGLDGCETSQAKITKGYRLPAKHVIHTVGPIWRGGNENEDYYLEESYKNSLKLAAKNKINTIAFPNISTGIYGFPKERAAKIALRTVKEYIRKSKTIEKVIFVVFDEENYEIYKKMLKS